MRYISFFRSFLWIVPFITCMLGYYIMGSFSFQEDMQAPSVIGYHIHDAIRTLSNHSLNVRILAEKEEPDLPQGVVISQSPDVAQKIKAQQSVYLIVTKKPPQKLAPQFMGLTEDEIVKKAKELNIYLKFFYKESLYPSNTAISQYPKAGESLVDNSMVAYISLGATPIRIFPSLKQKSISDVKQFLEQHNMSYQVFYKNTAEDNYSCDNCIIIDQKPLAGSLINISKRVNVQLTVDSTQNS